MHNLIPFLLLLIFTHILTYIGQLKKENASIQLGKKVWGFDYIEFFNDEILLKTRNAKNMVWIANHHSFLDSFMLWDIQRRYFPEHQFTAVISHRFAKLPWIGSFIQKNHIPIARPSIDKLIYNETNEFNPQEFIQRLRTISQSKKKTILIVYPEGTLYGRDTVSMNLKYNSNQHQYKHVLHPRYKGVHFINQYYVYDFLLDITLDYPIECQFELDKSLLDPLKMKSLNKKVILHFELYPSLNAGVSLDEIKEFLYDIWDKKENRLINSYHSEWRERLYYIYAHTLSYSSF